MTGFAFPLRNLRNSGEIDAFFGQSLSYTLFDRLTVGAEVRYSEEKKSVLDVGANILQTAEFTDTLPRFSVDYKLTDDVLLYASAAKGLKAGGFNGVRAGTVTIPQDEQAFGPESNWTYEIGAKSTLMEGRLVVNAALFSVDWSDMQIQALPSNTPANLVANTPVIYRNLGNAESKGIELETLFAATDHLTLNFSASFIDPTFSDDTLSFRFNGKCDDVVCPVNTSVGGNTLPRTPKTQLAGGVEWTSKFGDDFELLPPRRRDLPVRDADRGDEHRPDPAAYPRECPRRHLEGRLGSDTVGKEHPRREVHRELLLHHQRRQLWHVAG